MSVQLCIQHLEQLADATTVQVEDFQQEVSKRVKPLNGKERITVKAWATSELSKLTPGGGPLLMPPDEHRPFSRRVKMLQTVLNTLGTGAPSASPWAV